MMGNSGYIVNAKKQDPVREITLTIGIFFDGTGNNAANSFNMIKTCTVDLSDPNAESFLAKCTRDKLGVSGSGATSYIGYYTNIHWLYKLYKQDSYAVKDIVQLPLYIEGIGTEVGKSDSYIGQVFGLSDTGVIGKTDKAVSLLAFSIQRTLKTLNIQHPDNDFIIKFLQFDIFGFSRGAAAARHFANRIQYEDQAIISAVRQGMTGHVFNGSPAGKIRFIGLFDTVAAIGTSVNGLNPHSANTGPVKLALSPGVSEKVFHIVAQNECRFNFTLNSVTPPWPELALPGAHSDIGGGYLPVMKENLFLTRPVTQTVPFSLSGEKTQAYRQAIGQLKILEKSLCLGPLLRTHPVSAETWYDDRLPPDRYGQMRKRSYAALAIRGRTVTNHWSQVALRVMLEAAQEGGVEFYPIDPTDPDMAITDELIPLCEKALGMGKAARNGHIPQAFSQEELDVIARKYIHCSAHWNAVVVNKEGLIHGGALPSEITGFINRPDEEWKRTVYNMDGRKI